jgi:hypothetical protein
VDSGVRDLCGQRLPLGARLDTQQGFGRIFRRRLLLLRGGKRQKPGKVVELSEELGSRGLKQLTTRMSFLANRVVSGQYRARTCDLTDVNRAL